MSITVLKEDIKNLKKEINQFLKIVNYCQNEKVIIRENHINHKLNITNKKILKATVYLLLYNLIEATITKLIDEITDTINNDKISYNELIDNVKKAWIKLNCKESLRKCEEKNFSENLFNVLDTCVSGAKISLYKNLKATLSGNVDNDTIKRVCFEYGLEVLKECSELDIVKRKRNELAHGETSFSEVGGNITESDLLDYKKAIYIHLDSIIKKAEKYLSSKRYLKS